MEFPESLSALQARIGYQFKNVKLLQDALIHSSIGKQTPDKTSNQRLEFLGDRVLGLIIADHLYQNFQEEEGEMAKRLNAWVNKAACAEAARSVNLGEFLSLSNGERARGGAENEAILGDACEALIAAIYLDGGLDTARRSALKMWEAILNRPLQKTFDPKSALQEWSQGENYGIPAYRLLEKTGPEHAPVFKVEVKAGPFTYGPAEGGSKRSAEHAAAILALEALEEKKR